MSRSTCAMYIFMFQVFSLYVERFKSHNFDYLLKYCPWDGKFWWRSKVLMQCISRWCHHYTCMLKVSRSYLEGLGIGQNLKEKEENLQK